MPLSVEAQSWLHLRKRATSSPQPELPSPGAPGEVFGDPTGPRPFQGARDRGSQFNPGSSQPWGSASPFTRGSMGSPKLFWVISLHSSLCYKATELNMWGECGQNPLGIPQTSRASGPRLPGRHGR